MCPFRTRILLCLNFEEGFGHCYKYHYLSLPESESVYTVVKCKFISSYQATKSTYWQILFGQRRAYLSCTTFWQHQIAKHKIFYNQYCYCIETICSAGYMFTNVWHIISFPTLCPGIYYALTVVVHKLHLF